MNKVNSHAFTLRIILFVTADPMGKRSGLPTYYPKYQQGSLPHESLSHDNVIALIEELLLRLSDTGNSLNKSSTDMPLSLKYDRQSLSGYSPQPWERWASLRESMQSRDSNLPMRNQQMGRSKQNYVTDDSQTPEDTLMRSLSLRHQSYGSQGKQEVTC